MHSTLPSSSVLAVFPGQGSQFVGMGKNLYENFPMLKQLYEEASEAVHIDLKKLCFEGSETDLTLTENTQPCLLVTSYAAFLVAQREFGFKPHVVAGHSLGEYSALTAVGSLRLKDTAQWVRTRGIAMQRAVPEGQGKMAAILNLEEPKVIALCEKATRKASEKRQNQEFADLTVAPLVQPANFNATGQVVIAGSIDAIQQAVFLIKTEAEFSHGKAIPLQVSAPFHCQLMKPAAKVMEEVFLGVEESQKPKAPLCPYYANRTAQLTSEPQAIFPNLVDQVDHPVLWKQSMTHALSQNITACIEFGPGRVLTGLMKRIASQNSTRCQLISVGDTESLKDLGRFLDPKTEQTP